MRIDKIKTIAFDADDTLWANEHIFQTARKKSWELIKEYSNEDEWKEKTFSTEIGNLSLYGYGSKSYILSLIEAAISVSEGMISVEKINQMLTIGKEMIAAKVSLLAEVIATLETLSKHYDLMIITKGDLKEQEKKIEESGIKHFFSKVEIVSEKNEEVYKHILAKHCIKPEEFAMVGNSLKSDVLPISKIGGTGIHIPYHVTWEWEVPKNDFSDIQYISMKNMEELCKHFTCEVKAS